MKNKLTTIRAVACLLLIAATLPLLSCAACQSKPPVIYVVAGEVEKEVELDISTYEKGFTFADVLWEDDTLEADIDTTTDPDTVRSVCNESAASGEVFVLYSSDPEDAPAGTEPIKYNRKKFYRVEGDYLTLTVKMGTRYLLRLESRS